MRKILFILTLFTSALSFAQTTPTMRQVATAGTAITRLPSTAATSVSGTDTLMLFQSGIWKKTTASSLAGNIFANATYTTNVRPTDTAFFKVGANYYKSLYNGFHNVIGNFNLRASSSYSLVVGTDIYEKGPANYVRSVSGGDEQITSDGHLYTEYHTYALWRVFNAANTEGAFSTLDYNKYALNSTAPSFSITLSSNDASGSIQSTFSMKNTGTTISTPTLTIPGLGAGLGKVLTSDANGVATWQTLSTGLTNSVTAIASGTVGSILTHGTGDVLMEFNSKLYWDIANSRLGIGTALPSYPIHISNSTGQGLLITNTGEANKYLQLDFSSGTANFTTNAKFYFTSEIKTASGIFNGALASIKLQKNDRTGFILTTNDGVDTEAYISIGKATAPTQGTSLLVTGWGTSSASNTAEFHNSTGTSNTLVIRDDARVGIGTASPTSKLSVTTSAAASFIDATDGTVTMQGDMSNGGGGVGLNIGSTSAHPFYLMAGGTAKMTIESGGDVGIATTNPTRKFQVDGTIFANVTETNTPMDETKACLLTPGEYCAIQQNTAHAMTFNVYASNSNLQAASINQAGALVADRRFNKTQGADVASGAGAIALGTDGNVFEITGTDAITLISNVGWQNGSEVTLIFTSTAVLTNGTATSGTDITLILAGATNFTGSANDVLKLVLCEIGGVQAWREISRSVN